MKVDNHSHEQDRLQTLIKTTDEWAIGALLKIYSFQTADEQYTGGTHHNNAMGFNATDAEFMSSLSEQFLKKGSLSDKQIGYVKRIILKYIGQLMESGFEPVAINKTTSTILPKTLQKIIKTAELIKNNITIKFQYPKGDKQFFDMIKKIKTLPGRRFVKTEYCWKCPLSLKSFEKLEKWEFDLSSELQEWHSKMTAKPELNCDLKIPGFKKELYPFQKEGVSFIESRNGRALIGDEMGLGKTIQALAWLELHPELRPALIVVPASLKINWKNEIKDCMKSEKIHIISGEKYYKLPNKNIFIINYDVIINKRTKKYNSKTQKVEKKPVLYSGWVDHLKEFNFKTIILDESHYLASSKSYRSQDTIKLCKNAEHIIALSGTPITNRPLEFFNILKIIEPTLYPSRWDFCMRFCAPRHNGFGWDFTGASNTTKLSESLKILMLRHKKEDVLKDLPPKTKTIIPIEIDNYKEYKSAESDIISWIRENEGKEKAEKASRSETLVAFEKLKQLAVKGKMKQCIAWINNLVNSGQKLVIFADHKMAISKLMETYKDIAVKFDGSTSIIKRQQAVDRFNDDKRIKIFIGSKAAKEGISLKGVSNLAFIELYWVPGFHDQGEDRIHGINRGDENATGINIWYLLANNTIEEDIMELLGKKGKILGQVLDGKSVEDTNIFQDLLEKLKRKGR